MDFWFWFFFCFSPRLFSIPSQQESLRNVKKQVLWDSRKDFVGSEIFHLSTVFAVESFIALLHFVMLNFCNLKSLIMDIFTFWRWKIFNVPNYKRNEKEKIFKKMGESKNSVSQPLCRDTLEQCFATFLG